ncbi:Uncharacterized protein QTN25_004412 [Entamoeba marina]
MQSCIRNNTYAQFGQAVNPPHNGTDVVSSSQDKSDVNNIKDNLKRNTTKKQRRVTKPARNNKLLKLTQANLSNKCMLSISRQMLNNRIECWKTQAVEDAIIPHPFIFHL